MRVVGKRLFEDVTICVGTYGFIALCAGKMFSKVICVCFLVALVNNMVNTVDVWYYVIRFLYT